MSTGYKLNGDLIVVSSSSRKKAKRILRGQGVELKAVDLDPAVGTGSTRISPRAAEDIAAVRTGWTAGGQAPGFVGPPNFINPVEVGYDAMAASTLSALIPWAVKVLAAMGYAVTAEALIEWATGTTGLTTVDDIVQGWIQNVSGIPLLGAPASAGWVPRTRYTYYRGQRKEVKGFYKPYKQMTQNELNAYWQGYFVARVRGNKKANRAYKRGLKASQGGDQAIPDYMKGFIEGQKAR